MIYGCKVEIIDGKVWPEETLSPRSNPEKKGMEGEVIRSSGWPIPATVHVSDSEFKSKLNQSHLIQLFFQCDFLPH